MTKFSELPIHTFGYSVQMAGAVYVGGGRSFLFIFPDDALEGDLETVPASLDDWKELVRQTDMLDMELLVKQPDGSVRKAIYRKSERQIDQNVTWAVFRRDGYSCRYGGKNDVPLTVDHLIPHHEGGPSVEGNLLSACRKCNKVRGDIQYPDWLQHPFYLERAKGLTPAVREQNIAVAHTLDKIHRVKAQDAMNTGPKGPTGLDQRVFDGVSGPRSGSGPQGPQGAQFTTTPYAMGMSVHRDELHGMPPGRLESIHGQPPPVDPAEIERRVTQFFSASSKVRKGPNIECPFCGAAMVVQERNRDGRRSSAA